MTNFSGAVCEECKRVACLYDQTDPPPRIVCTPCRAKEQKPKGFVGFYDYNTPDLVEEGIYLIRVTDKAEILKHDPSRLYVAEYTCGSWYPTGVEYDPFMIGWHKGITIEVITRFDLESIEKSARAQL